jgi:hypothetical protein
MIHCIVPEQHSCDHECLRIPRPLIYVVTIAALQHHAVHCRIDTSAASPGLTLQGRAGVNAPPALDSASYGNSIVVNITLLMQRLLDLASRNHTCFAPWQTRVLDEFSLFSFPEFAYLS